jgi:hypothetical protein
LRGRTADFVGGGGGGFLGLGFAGGDFGGPSGSVLLLPRMKDGMRKSRKEEAGLLNSLVGSAGLAGARLDGISSGAGLLGGGLPSCKYI